MIFISASYLLFVPRSIFWTIAGRMKRLPDSVSQSLIAPTKLGLVSCWSECELRYVESLIWADRVERVEPVRHRAERNRIKSKPGKILGWVDLVVWTESMRRESVDITLPDSATDRSHLSTSCERISFISSNMPRILAGPKTGMRMRSASNC